MKRYQSNGVFAIRIAGEESQLNPPGAAIRGTSGFPRPLPHRLKTCTIRCRHVHHPKDLAALSDTSATISFTGNLIPTTQLRGTRSVVDFGPRSVTSAGMRERLARLLLSLRVRRGLECRQQRGSRRRACAHIHRSRWRDFVFTIICPSSPSLEWARNRTEISGIYGDGTSI